MSGFIPRYKGPVFDASIIQAEVDLNTAKVGITPQQALDIETNNAKSGGGIVGVQRGIFHFNVGGAGVSTITLPTAVDVLKSVVTVNVGASDYRHDSYPTVELTNSTTLTCTNRSSGTTVNAYIAWQVVEHA